MKLSFLIPTYNRIDHIEKQIPYYIEMLSSENIDYEIIIGDNSTNDDTYNYIKHNPDERIKYFKNSDNLGYDKNVLKCYAYSTGDYVWLVGDKNYFEKEHLRLVIKELRLNPDALVITKGIEKKSYDNVSDLVREVGFRFSTLDCTILKGECRESLYKAEKYIGYNFIHIGIIFEYLCAKDNISVNWYPYSIMKVWSKNKVYWYNNRFRIFANNWFKTIMSLPNTIDINAKIECLKGSKQNHIFKPSQIYKRRIRGIKYSIKDLKENREYVELTSHTNYFSILVSLILPVFPINLLYKIKTILSKR